MKKPGRIGVLVAICSFILIGVSFLILKDDLHFGLPHWILVPIRCIFYVTSFPTMHIITVLRWFHCPVSMAADVALLAAPGPLFWGTAAFLVAKRQLEKKRDSEQSHGTID
jgi:hypothetical protein